MKFFAITPAILIHHTPIKVLLSLTIISAVLLGCSKHEEMPSGVQLQVSTLTPDKGPVGTLVTIEGKGFSNTLSENTVTFNGIPGIISTGSPTTLIASVPAQATTGPVKVRNGKAEVLAGTFTVIPDSSPSSLEFAGMTPTSGFAGTKVSFTGKGFSLNPSENIVKFDGTPGEIESSSATQMVAIVPPGATTGLVTIQVGNSVVNGLIFTVMNTNIKITEVSPQSGAVNSKVTIKGTGFKTTLSGTVVKFNGIPATISLITSTEIEVTVPMAATTGPITIETDGVVITGPVFTVVLHQKIDVTTIAGDGTTAKLYAPAGLALYEGDILVADKNNHRIARVSLQKGTISAFAGGKNAYRGPKDGPVSSAEFNFPQGIAVDQKNEIYVTDTYNNSIRKISKDNANTFFVTTVAGSTYGYGGFMDSYANNALFFWPVSITISSLSNNVYIVDANTFIIRRIDPFMNVTTIAGTVSKQGYADGNGKSASFSWPYGIAVDKHENVYIADGINGIRKIDRNNQVSTFVSGLNVQSLAINQQGHIFAGGSSKLYEIDEFGTVSVIAGTTQGYRDGDGATAQFNGIKGIVIDAQGNLYVSDESNNRIRKITFN
jgi:hypothetical protein